MGMLEKVGKLGHKMAAGYAKKKILHNVVGDVCTWAFSSEKNQTRCKATTRLYDIAKSGVKAVGSCGATVGAGVAEVGSGGLASPIALPAGVVAGGSCLYNGAKTIDSSQAMVRQMYTGKEVKSGEEQLKENVGTWVKEKAKKGYDSWVESQTRMPPVYMPIPF